MVFHAMVTIQQVGQREDHGPDGYMRDNLQRFAIVPARLHNSKYNCNLLFL